MIPPPAPAAVRMPGQLSEQPSSCRRRSIRTRSRLDTVPSSIPTRPLPGPLFAVVRQARGKPMNREEAESIISVRGAVLPPRCAAGSAPRDHRRSRPAWQVLMVFTVRSIGLATSRFHSATTSYIYRRSGLHTDRFACPHRRPVYVYRAPGRRTLDVSWITAAPKAIERPYDRRQWGFEKTAGYSRDSKDSGDFRKEVDRR